MTARNRLGWADYTFDVITGCRYQCRYCFAKVTTTNMAGDIRWNKAQTDKYEVDSEGRYTLTEPFMRPSGKQNFWPFGFEPTLHLYRLTNNHASVKLLKGRGKRIFVGNFSDMFGEWVPDNWIRLVMDAVEMWPKNNYLFMTRNPTRLSQPGLIVDRKNFWYGTTVTSQEDFYRLHELPKLKEARVFVNFSPLIGPVTDDLKSAFQEKQISWGIIGEMRGYAMKKIKTERSWVERIASEAESLGIPVFMMDSIGDLMGDDFRQEYPPDLEKRELSEEMRCRLEADCFMCGKHGDKREMFSVGFRPFESHPSAAYIGFVCRDCVNELAVKAGTTVEAVEERVRHK